MLTDWWLPEVEVSNPLGPVDIVGICNNCHLLRLICETNNRVRPFCLWYKFALPVSFSTDQYLVNLGNYGVTLLDLRCPEVFDSLP